MTTHRTLTSTHWGVYEVEWENGKAKALHPFSSDPDPSPIGLHMLSPEVTRLRVQRPAIRKGWLDGLRSGGDRARERRGQEPFVEVPWDEALDMVAGELRRVIDAHGNASVFGGSYGWSSAGRFHHAQSQVHRFLNSVGGYVRHMDSYSLGAARVLLPHIVATMDELQASHTSWEMLAKHCELFVCFGGVPRKNSQVGSGGAHQHRTRDGLYAMAKAGVRFINVTPTRDDLDTGAEVEWIPTRPGSDTAMLLGLMHTVYTEGLHDQGFLDRYTVGFEKFLPYLLGKTDGQPKTPAWAAAITGVPAARIVALAREMAAHRTVINIAWSLQRAHHGEQPFWAVVTLACMLGQVGTPGGGFASYGPANLMGSPHPRFPGPVLPQGTNAVGDFIPVARIADLLLNPGKPFDYNGKRQNYADIRFVYWAGGNPFHHHQDLNRLLKAWQKPETIVINEQYWTPAAKHADVVFPATTSLERDDIGSVTRERSLIAMKQATPPVGEARDDYAIFSALAARLGASERYTEGRDTRQWLEHLYEGSRAKAAERGIALPEFAAFWEAGIAEVEGEFEPPVLFGAFRADPDKAPLSTPSGKIEIFSERIAGFGYDDCPGHATWLEPAEWLGAQQAKRFPLHLLSDQPSDKLHSQLDHSPHSQATKIKGRQPINLNPHDARARGIQDGDLVRVYNDRGACLAAAKLTDALRPGVARISTGAWFDPAGPGANQAMDKHGNPNVLTLDIGASKLSQGCAAQTCLVEVETWDGPVPEVTAHKVPEMRTASPRSLP